MGLDSVELVMAFEEEFGAAKWSLASNAKQHAAVLKVCKKSLESDNLQIKKLITEILNKQ